MSMESVLVLSWYLSLYVGALVLVWHNVKKGK